MARHAYLVHAGGVSQLLLSTLMQQCSLEMITHLACTEGMLPLQVRKLCPILFDGCRVALLGPASSMHCCHANCQDLVDVLFAMRGFGNEVQGVGYSCSKLHGHMY